MPRRSTILKRERSVKAIKAAPRLPVRLVTKAVEPTECQEIVTFLEGITGAIVANMKEVQEEGGEVNDDWLRAVELANEKATRLCRLISSHHMRYKVDKEITRRAIKSELLDREAMHTAALEAIASTSDPWKVRVQKALRAVHLFTHGQNAYVADKEKMTIPGDPTSTLAVVAVRAAEPPVC